MYQLLSITLPAGLANGAILAFGKMLARASSSVFLNHSNFSFNFQGVQNWKHFLNEKKLVCALKLKFFPSSAAKNVKYY